MVKMVLDCLVEEKSIALAHIPLDNTALVADQMIVWLQGRFADDSDRLIMKCYQLLPDAKPDLEHVEELVGFWGQLYDYEFFRGYESATEEMTALHEYIPRLQANLDAVFVGVDWWSFVQRGGEFSS